MATGYTTTAAVARSRSSGRRPSRRPRPHRRATDARGAARSAAAPDSVIALLEPGGLQVGLGLGRPLEEELRAELVGVRVVRERLGRHEVRQLGHRRLDVLADERAARIVGEDLL